MLCLMTWKIQQFSSLLLNCQALLFFSLSGNTQNLEVLNNKDRKGLTYVLLKSGAVGMSCEWVHYGGLEPQYI